VGCLNDEIISTVMAGYEGHRGWINYLAVLLAYRRSSVSRQMMEAAESLLFSFGCPKINLQVRRSNRGVIKFYQDIGYKEDEVLSMGKRLVSDE
jgi:ribosomal protein S18 acetylase RimI-like enzyme